MFFPAPCLRGQHCGATVFPDPFKGRQCVLKLRKTRTDQSADDGYQQLNWSHSTQKADAFEDERGRQLNCVRALDKREITVA